MSGSGTRHGDGGDGPLDRGWIDWCETSEVAPSPASGKGKRRRRSRGSLRSSVVMAGLLVVTLSSIAVAQSPDEESGPSASAAAGENRPIDLGTRNPGTGSSTKETAIVANVANGGLVVRPSNTAAGGRAISATCNNNGTAPEDGCAVYVNKGQGAAASFRTNGTVPFAIRDTNNGMVANLNADMLDGKNASDFVAAGATVTNATNATNATNSQQLGGKPAADYLLKTETATDSSKLGGKEPNRYLSHGGFVNSAGTTTQGAGFTSSRQGVGAFNISFPAGTFPLDDGNCHFPVPSVHPFSGSAVMATSSAVTCSNDGSGSFNVRLFNDAGVAVDSSFLFLTL